MPLNSPGTIAAMDAQVQNITDNLPSSASALEDWDAAAAWAPVATAFFSSAAIPVVTPAGILAGEIAFKAAVHSQVDAVNTMTEGALSSGFKAYADEIVKPLNCTPPAPVVHVPPPAAPFLSMSNPPSLSTLPATTNLYNQLLEWAVLGTQTTPAPSTVPWS